MKQKNQICAASTNVTIHMKVIVRAKKVGRHFVVTLPKAFVKENGISGGELLHMGVEKFQSGFGMFKGMGPFTEEDEFDFHDI